MHRPTFFHFPSRESGKRISTYLIPTNLALAMRSGSQISLLHPVSKATLLVTYVGCLASTTGHCMQKSSGTDNSEINLQQEHSLKTQKVLLSCLLFISVALRPNAGHGLLILEVSRSHTTTHHTR